MAIGIETERTLPADAAAAAPPRPSGLTSAPSRVLRIVSLGAFSSLTRRIVFVNLAALVLLVGGILVLNQFRAGLIDARVQSLFTQGETIARQIAADAAFDNSVRRIDPQELFAAEAGAAAGLLALDSSTFFSIDPERAGQIIGQVISPGQVRARLYDSEGGFLYDSRYATNQILTSDLPPPGSGPSWLERAWNTVTGWFGRDSLPVYRDTGWANGSAYPEVASALVGERATTTWVNDRGAMIVSVAVPVQRVSAVMGVLQLSTPAGDIDAIVSGEREAILNIFALVVVVTVLLSLLLAGTIATPLRKLADAADRVRKGGLRMRPQIPDFSRRRDEIGHLSVALREMTNSLYSRIDAIESFAADVSHELKNPLTSLRSAVETLPLAKTEAAKARLAGIIQHDVRRLDRLISDIADASRLDAELTRREAEPVDLLKLLQTVVTIAGETTPPGGPRIVLSTAEAERGGYVVSGHDIRLSQVFNNLLDNARSFSPPGSTIKVFLRRAGRDVEIIVEDEGPGIKAEQIERIFDRFYTDRPEQDSFGQNSGLGLSISRQIVEAHHGRIRPENIIRPAAGKTGVAEVAGARFTVRLPAARSA